MSTDDSSNTSRPGGLIPMGAAAGFVKSLFGRERGAVQEQRFTEFVSLLERYERYEASKHDEMMRALYQAWSEKFELLKREFNSAWDLFCSLEQQLTGWYAVSPNLAPWQSVACGRGGYTFAACIMKNHHRHAPLSEKSLSVSFGLGGAAPGIGDERWIGVHRNPTDALAGLTACAKMEPRRQAEGMRALVERLSHFSLVFRLNHKKLGQQAATFPLSLLDQHSMYELCQGLFMLLNNDLLSELQAALACPDRLQLAHNQAIVVEAVNGS